MMAPRFIELAQVFLALIPGTGMDSLEVHDGDASGLYGFLADSHLESSADEDDSSKGKYVLNEGGGDGEIEKMKEGREL